VALYLVNFQILGRTAVPWFQEGPDQVFELFAHAGFGLLLVPFFLSARLAREPVGLVRLAATALRGRRDAPGDRALRALARIPTASCPGTVTRPQRSSPGKGSNTRSRSAAGTPAPVSVTSISTEPPLDSAATVTLPSAGV
jgi:hypothetical protein